MINQFLRLSLMLLVLFFAQSNLLANSLEQKLTSLADDYYKLTLEHAQPTAYFYNFKLSRHQKFLTNTAESLQQLNNSEDDILKQLHQIDSSKLESEQAKIFYAKFKESLESSITERICKSELWDVSHMFGAHTMLDFLLSVQPLETEQNRNDALQRWREAADYYQQKITNLNLGLKLGYSAPKRVVKRLLTQLKNLTEIEIETHPFLKLSARTENAVFKKQYKQLLEQNLLPALKTFVSYLENDYLPAARSELGLHALPNGRACYMALYRHYTTLQYTPEQVHDIGTKAVNDNIKKVTALGKKLYGTSTFEGTVEKANQDKSQDFSSAEEMHNFFVDVVKRSKAVMPVYFYKMPEIEMVVEAIPEYQQGTGRSAHYNQGSETRAAEFRYDPTTYPMENHGSGEIVTVHEGYPGHHMQIALVQNMKPYHPVEVLFSNSAFAEGWARYSESLAEEAGIYQSKSAKITRRTWPARGMVADTGMHLLGWSNETVANYLAASGKSFAKAPDVMMDRMASIPAQLTAYDSGALEIFALRRKAEQALGDKFDIKEFHQQILKNGNVPMSVLREQVTNSIKHQ